MIVFQQRYFVFDFKNKDELSMICSAISSPRKTASVTLVDILFHHDQHYQSLSAHLRWYMSRAVHRECIVYSVRDSTSFDERGLCHHDCTEDLEAENARAVDHPPPFSSTLSGHTRDDCSQTSIDSDTDGNKVER